MPINRFLLILIVSCIFISSCETKKTKPNNAVARVNDKYLTTDDIADIVLFKTHAEDSAAVIKSFIDKWIKEQIIADIAEKNLPESKKQFKNQLNAYRNSLVIYEYEKELIRQKLDTIVTEQQIKDYYEKHPAEFILKDNIVKVNFVKLPVNSTKINIFKNLILSNNPVDKIKLNNECKRHAVNFFLDENTWLLFDDLLKEIPIKTYDQETFLKNNRFIEMKDSEYYYLVNIKGFMIKESVSSLDFEKNRIVNIILNKRKLELIENMRESLYQEAQRNNVFQIY